MRHYIYLEEHRMAYASGKPRFAEGREKAAAVLAKSRCWETRGASLDSDLKKLAEYYGLPPLISGTEESETKFMLLCFIWKGKGLQSIKMP